MNLNSDYIDNMNGFGFLWISSEEAKAGTYELRVSNLYYGKDAVQDFVVNVYAKTQVSITDKQGKTSDASKVQVFDDGTTLQLLP